MINETEAPELLSCPFCGGEPVDSRPIGMTRCTDANCVAGQRWAFSNKWNTRADISDAKDARIAELEAERDNWKKVAFDALTMKETAEARAEAAEANLAKAVEILERIAHASDVYGVESNAEDQGADTLAYAHKSTCNLARTTLAELTTTPTERETP